MNFLNRAFMVALTTIIFFGCGVKGKPRPPITKNQELQSTNLKAAVGKTEKKSNEMKGPVK